MKKVTLASLMPKPKSATNTKLTPPKPAPKGKSRVKPAAPKFAHVLTKVVLSAETRKTPIGRRLAEAAARFNIAVEEV